MRRIVLSIFLGLSLFAGFAPAAHAGSTCKDGSWTASEGRGTCSGHGGVSQSGVAGPSAPAPAPAPVVVTPPAPVVPVVTPTPTPTPVKPVVVTPPAPVVPPVTTSVPSTRYCKDGTAAKSVGRGACSGHGGLAPVGGAVPAATTPNATPNVAAPAGDIVLPNGSTPGAINPAVTQDNIRSTICKSGYTTTIRPSSSYTTALKKQQLNGAYSYFADKSTGAYEEDHLISLELGGAPSDPRNLWPEPYAGSTGARVKDTVENRLNSLVCSGAISLATAQNAIATNWWTAYQTYVK